MGVAQCIVGVAATACSGGVIGGGQLARGLEGGSDEFNLVLGIANWPIAARLANDVELF